MDYKSGGREFKPHKYTLLNIKLGYGVGMVISGGGKVEQGGMNTRIREGRLVGKREEEFF